MDTVTASVAGIAKELKEIMALIRKAYNVLEYHPIESGVMLGATEVRLSNLLKSLSSPSPSGGSQSGPAPSGAMVSVLWAEPPSMSPSIETPATVN